MTIKVLKQQGKSIKMITRETSLSRNTVKKYFQRTDTKTVYQRKAHRPSKLDPFKDYIQSRIDAAHPDWILHHCHIIQISGESYRLKDKRKIGIAPIMSEM